MKRVVTVTSRSLKLPELEGWLGDVRFLQVLVLVTPLQCVVLLDCLRPIMPPRALLLAAQRLQVAGRLALRSEFTAERRFREQEVRAVGPSSACEQGAKLASVYSPVAVWL